MEPKAQVLPLSYRMERIFDAPVALVFEAWTNAEHFVKWWGPHGMNNIAPIFDLQEGKDYRIAMVDFDGTQYPLHGKILELVPNKRLVMTMHVDEHPKAWRQIYNTAKQAHLDDAMPQVTTTVEFEDLGGKTKMSVEQAFADARDRDTFLRLGTTIGWGHSFSKLEGLMATLGTDKRMIVMRTINASAEQIFGAWSTAESMGNWFGPNGFTCDFESFEFKVGGEIYFKMIGPDGTVYENYIQFSKLDRPKLIEYRQGGSKDDPNMFTARFELQVIDTTHTKVILSLNAASAEQRSGMLGFGAFEGGDQTLNRLANMLEPIPGIG